MKNTTQPKRFVADAPEVTPELRAFVDEVYGEDFAITSVGLTRAYITNPSTGGKIEIPEDLRSDIAKSIEKTELLAKRTAEERAAAEAEAEAEQAAQLAAIGKAKDLLKRTARAMQEKGIPIDAIQNAGYPVDHLQP